LLLVGKQASDDEFNKVADVLHRIFPDWVEFIDSTAADARNLSKGVGRWGYLLDVPKNEVDASSTMILLDCLSVPAGTPAQRKELFDLIANDKEKEDERLYG